MGSDGVLAAARPLNHRPGGQGLSVGASRPLAGPHYFVPLDTQFPPLERPSSHSAFKCHNHLEELSNMTRRLAGFGSDCICVERSQGEMSK